MQAATRSLFLSVKRSRPVWRLSSPISCVALFSTQTLLSSPPKHPRLPPICDMNALDNEMSKIVGLDDLKIQLRKWLKGKLLYERHRALGLKVGPRRLPQFAFLGNPGTGKTMVGCMLGRLLRMVGILPYEYLIRVTKSDLVDQYVGETGYNTRYMIEEAEGGILFVDEAHCLVPTLQNNEFGMEALEELMSFMDGGRIVVVLAGYTKPMQHLFSSNKGLRSRVSNIFQFDDFNCEQLAEILHLKLSSKDEDSPFYGFKLDPRSTGVKDVAALIERGTTAEQRRKVNGELVNQMLVKTRENLVSRIDVERSVEYPTTAITLKDLADGLQLLRVEEEQLSGWNKLRSKMPSFGV